MLSVTPAARTAVTLRRRDAEASSFSPSALSAGVAPGSGMRRTTKSPSSTPSSAATSAVSAISLPVFTATCGQRFEGDRGRGRGSGGASDQNSRVTP
jgi:hypothetical protein